MTASGPRADLLPVENTWVRAGRIHIDAPRQALFDLVADPRRHSDFDGSGTVQGAVHGPERLYLGAKFGMKMKIGLPYRIDNTVVEFEEGYRIAWRHIGRHRWRYEFADAPDGGTIVTETFDGSTAIFPPALKLINAYENNQKAVLKTLARMKVLAESGGVSS